MAEEQDSKIKGTFFPSPLLLVTKVGEEFIFETVESVREWVEKEKVAWNFFFSQYVNRPNNRFDGFLNRITTALTADSIKEVHSQLQNIFQQKDAYQFSSAWPPVEGISRDLEILKQLEHGVDIVFDKRINQGFNTVNLRGFIGVIAGRMIPNYTPEFTQMRAAHQQWAVDEEKRKESAQQLKGRITTLEKEKRDSLDHLAEEKGKNLDKVAEEKSKNLSELHDKHKSNLEGLEHAFQEKLRLQTSIKYWDEKKETHAKGATRWGWIFAVLVGAGLGVLAWWGKDLAKWAVDNGGMGGWLNPSLALLVLGATLYLWLLRLPMRLFQTHLSLREDAAERGAMLQTFLALINEGKMEPEQRLLVLQAVFRPSRVAGSEGGETLPPNALDALLKQLQGKG